MKFVHKILQFIQFFLFIFCLFTTYLHAPLMQYHTNHSILQKRLFDTDSRAFSFTFRFDPRLTRYRLRSSKVWNTVFFFFFLYSFIFSRPLNSIENKSLTIHSIPAYQGRSFFFPQEEIDTSRVSLSTKQSRVLTIQKRKVFENIVEEGENDGG